jgi:2-polyprenyl-3-methyl-5-hydroxy-6-metoxy-1,4-benzoquinol methylase
LLRQLSSKIDRALDVDCGLGIFALKLAEKLKFVDALDIDGAILQEASKHCNAPKYQE